MSRSNRKVSFGRIAAQDRLAAAGCCQRLRTPERKVEEAFGFADTSGPAAKTTSLRLVKLQTTLGRAGAESGLGRSSPVSAWGSVGFRLGGAVPACQSQDITVSAWPDGLRPAQACGRLLKSPEIVTGSDLTKTA